MRRHALTLEVPHAFHGEALLVFFGRHAVPGVEAYRDQIGADGSRRLVYARTLRLPHGPAVIELVWSRRTLTAAAHLTDDRDLAAAQQRVVHLCDLERDLRPVQQLLARDPHLAPLLAASPGLRVPGSADAHEQLIRTMVGQQISLAGAANCAGKLAVRFGEALEPEPYETEAGPLSRLFPAAAALATADPLSLPMPAARGRALVAAAEDLAAGSLVLDVDSDPLQTRASLLAQPGIGPWTADYVLMRALHAPDILLTSDLIIKRELARRAIKDTADWAPWRSYATVHLWRSWTG